SYAGTIPLRLEALEDVGNQSLGEILGRLFDRQVLAVEIVGAGFLQRIVLAEGIARVRPDDGRFEGAAARRLLEAHVGQDRDLEAVGKTRGIERDWPHGEAGDLALQHRIGAGRVVDHLETAASEQLVGHRAGENLLYLRAGGEV